MHMHERLHGIVRRIMQRCGKVVFMNMSSAVAEMGDHARAIGRKVEGCYACPFPWGSWVTV